jgi:peptidoglycan hydrolase-like protein with peptidoglycan-binding domain
MAWREEMPAVPSLKIVEEPNQAHQAAERAAGEPPQASQQARDKTDMLARELQTAQQQEREQAEALVQDLAALRRLTGNEARDLQSRLKAAGFDPGPIDGVVGRRTTEAARHYSQTHPVSDAGPSKDLVGRLRAESADLGR